MRAPIFQLDAFTTRRFAGNPAAVVPMESFPSDQVLQAIAAERLGKAQFHAYQASRRGGQIDCRLAGDRVELQGACVFYFEGEVEFE